jgi:hypothetical protein
VLISFQHKGHSVGALGFSTNSGDTHCNLDMVKDATIRVSDLRLRFSLYGDTSKLGPHRIIDPPGFIGPGEFRDAHTSGSPKGSNGGGQGPGFIFTVENLTVHLNIPFVVFGDYPLSYGITKEKGVLHFDLILLSGRARALDFRTLEQACLGFTIEVTEGTAGAARSWAAVEGGVLKAGLDGEKKILVAIPAKPAVIEELYAHSRGEIDGKNVNNLV